MILQFSVKNFKSIKNELTVDFRKASISEHKDSLIDDEVLPTTVFYGPNGSGKSNILKAIDFLIRFVTTPIQNNRAMNRNDASFRQMPLLKPYVFDNDSKNASTEFNIIFTLSLSDKTEYSYSLELLNDKVISESLYEKQTLGKPAKLFERNGLDISFGTKIQKPVSSNQIISPQYAFLSTCTIFLNIPQITAISHFFTGLICIDYSEPVIEKGINNVSFPFLTDNELKTKVVNFVRSFNLGIVDYSIDSNTELPLLERIKTIHDKGSLTLSDESMGTIKIFMAITPIYLSLSNGSPLVIDELDAKIHPKLLEFVISLFTDPNINKYGSQLIFTSHDMYTLNSSVFRRDEVWFVAKDLDDSTFCYSLVDIKNEKDQKERKDSVYYKRYLEGKYGADPYFKKMNNWEEIDG